MRNCPHEDIQFCPLYVAAHETAGLGCAKGLTEEGCGVANGVLDYGRQLARLVAADPEMVTERAMAEFEAERKAQRARNLRVNGIH